MDHHSVYRVRICITWADAHIKRKHENQKTNHHAGIIDLFDTVFVETNKIQLATSFKELVYKIRENEPSETFAKEYIAKATAFFETIETYRALDLSKA